MVTDSTAIAPSDSPDSIDIIALTKLAIDAALKCEWDKALDLNSQIIEVEPQNVECLNRLAKAYCELGQYSEAKKLYHQVLGIDAYNTIAQKNLQKVSAFKKDGKKTNGISMTLSPASFLEEPGCTKSVPLIKLAEPQRLLTLSAGMMVNLMPKSRAISVTDLSNQYLGALPDDTSHHLLKLIKGGNKYQAFIKSVKSNRLVILIREVHRSKKFRNQASFLDGTKNLTLSSDHLSIMTGNTEEEPPEETEETIVI